MQRKSFSSWWFATSLTVGAGIRVAVVFILSIIADIFLTTGNFFVEIAKSVVSMKDGDEAWKR